MQFPHLLGAIHGLILIGLAWRSSGRLFGNAGYRLCSAYLLIWGNLVFTALILSAFSALDRVGLYFSVSLVLAAGLELFLHVRHIMPHCLEHRTSLESPPRLDRLVKLVLGAVLASVAVATLLICIHYVPNNWDTCTYRLSRAFFYLGHGNLLHPGHPPDPRLAFYPFNGTLLNLFLAIYQFPPQSFTFISAFTWLFAGLAVYCAARSLGASRTGGFVAAWVCLMTPNVLAQAASGNDEILAATPLLMGLFFAAEWLHTQRMRYALLAGVGIGLGLGTKLHWAFYWVVVCIAAAVLGLRVLRSRELRSQLFARVPAILAASAIVAPLAASFLVCNYISTKHLTDAAFNDQVLNTPFRPSLAREKIETSTGEMLLSPIPDLVPPLHPERRQSAYAAFNQFFMKCCFSNLVETTQRSVEGYQFIGPSDQYAYLPSEITVWLGLLPHFMLLVCLMLVFTRKLPIGSLLLIAAFWLWHLTYAMETRYIYWACTYYCFPAIISAAAIGLAWDFARSSPSTASRLLSASFLILFAAQLLLGANLLVFGGLRNVHFVFDRNPYREMHPVDNSVVAAVAAARNIYIPATHWEVLYWNFMRFNPAAKYSTGQILQPPTPDTLMLLSMDPSIARVNRAGENLTIATLAARLPDSSVPALTYIGDANNDHVFAQGDEIHTRYPGRDRYVLLEITWRQHPVTGAILRSETACCTGVQPADQVAFRYAFQSNATGKRMGPDWSVTGLRSGVSFAAANTGYDTLVIETEDLKHPGTVERTVYPLSQTRYEIPKKEVSSTASYGQGPGVAAAATR
jgi:hypothetical protein